MHSRRRARPSRSGPRWRSGAGVQPASGRVPGLCCRSSRCPGRSRVPPRAPAAPGPRARARRAHRARAHRARRRAAPRAPRRCAAGDARARRETGTARRAPAGSGAPPRVRRRSRARRVHAGSVAAGVPHAATSRVAARGTVPFRADTAPASRLPAVRRAGPIPRPARRRVFARRARAGRLACWSRWSRPRPPSVGGRRRAPARGVPAREGRLRWSALRLRAAGSRTANRLGRAGRPGAPCRARSRTAGRP